MYNKRQFHKTADKKVLHKVRKQWVTISVALLALVGGSVLANHINVSANSNNSNNINTQGQTNSTDQLHNRLISATRTNVQSINNSSNSVQNIQQKANQVHRNILKHAVMATPTTITNSSHGSNTSRKTVSYGKTINGRPAKKFNNMKRLRIHHAADYRGYIFSRNNVPFRHIIIRHKVLLHNKIFLNEDHPKHSIKRGNVKILRAYKQYGHDGIYTRYLIHINHRNRYITGNSHFVSFVAPSKHYRYYQHKINKILNDANDHKFNKIRRAVKRLNRKHITNYKRYMNLYINAYNLQQNIQHPVVVNYRHKYVHYKYNHNDNRQSNNDLVKFLNNPASNGSNLSSSAASSISPNHVSPFIPSNDGLPDSSASNHNIIPNKSASNGNNHFIPNGSNSVEPSSNNSDMDSYYASSTAQSADESIADSYKNSVSISVLAANQSKAKSAANSADQSIEDSIANSYAESTENTSSYKNSVSASNSRTASLAAKLADRSLDDFIAGSYAKSADNSIANSYSASVINSVSSLDRSIATSYAKSADDSIASAEASKNKSANSSASSHNVTPDDSNNDSYYASSAARSADESIAALYRNSVSASVSIGNQSKARSAASSADKGIEDSIADSYAEAANNSILNSYQNSVANSVNSTNARTAESAARSADDSISSSIADSYAKSADDSIADSISASVSNSVSALDQSIANSAKNSADNSIASSMSPAHASEASVISQFTSETLNDINQARQASGLNGLQINSDLENISKLRAKQLLTDYSYSDKDHRYYFDDDVNKLNYMTLPITHGEIIGKSPTNVHLTVKNGNSLNTYTVSDGQSMAKMNVDAHYNYFMNKVFSDIGISAIYNNTNKNYYLVIDLASKIPKISSDERYLIADNSGKSVRLNNIDSDGTYSGYTYSTGYGLVHVINKKNVLGYHFDEVDYHPKTNNQTNDHKFWVFSDELSTDPSAKFTSINEWNNFINTFNDYNRKDYTTSDLSKISNIRQQHNKLLKDENSNDISTPTKMKEYRKHIVDWINFYRGLHGLSPVTENSSFDDYAQKHAEIKSDPECMIPGDPNGNAIAPSVVSGYYTDTNDLDQNGTPGHRISILNPRADKIGVGERGSVNTLYFDQGFNSPIVNKDMNITYPNAGIYPINYASQGKSDFWGYSFIASDDVNQNTFPVSYSGIVVKNPSVSVHDDTDNKNVMVSDIHNDTNVGSKIITPYSGAIYYKVDVNALRANHKYTITISGQGIPNGSYTYSTRLFEL